jgi:hypothetical protein
MHQMDRVYDCRARSIQYRDKIQKYRLTCLKQRYSCQDKTQPKMTHVEELKVSSLSPVLWAMD